MPARPAALLEDAERLLDQRDVPAALAAFNAAEAAGAHPNRCVAGRWLAAMLLGDFEQAWRENDRLRARNVPDPHRFWQGEDLRGARVIVRCLHGFGDAVQMLRYAPLLRGLAASVVFEVPPRLVPLAPFFDGVDNVITWGDSAPAIPPAWDVQLEIMELPYIFRTTLAALPIARDYLRLPPSLIQQTAAMTQTTRLRVGIVWAGGEWNPARSLPLTLLKPVLDTPGCEFWNLQGGPPAAQAVASGMSAICGDGLLQLAATIAQLDLVITVDTLAAHLAGALGKPAWLLLLHAADWRWMNARDDAPWYPSLRLFRQPAPGDWAGVVAAAGSALRLIASEEI